METYKNSYDEYEDMMLWELHEIRHELHKEIRQKSIKEINRDAHKIFKQWQQKYNSKCSKQTHLSQCEQ